MEKPYNSCSKIINQGAHEIIFIYSDVTSSVAFCGGSGVGMGVIIEISLVVFLHEFPFKSTMFKDSGLDVFVFRLRELAEFDSCCIVGSIYFTWLNSLSMVVNTRVWTVGTLFCIRDRSAILDEEG